MKYHVNLETGKTGKCEAEIRNCPVGGEHFEKESQARAHFESHNEDMMFSTTNSEIEAHEISISQIDAYSKWTAINGYLHNGYPMADEEVLYYKSPVGMLEVERRLALDPNYKEYLEIKADVEANGFQKLEISKEDDEKFEALVKEGEILMTSYNDDSYEPDFLDGDRRDKRVEAYLAQQSNAWLKKLKIEEIEIISSATSAGFYSTELSRDDDKLTEETISHIVPFLPPCKKKEFNSFEAFKKELKPEFVDYARKYTDKFKQAVSKAPIAEKPFKTYRGIHEDEILETFARPGETAHDVIHKILNDDLVGKSLSNNSLGKPALQSRIAHAPLSTTVKPNRVLLFADAIKDNDENSYEIVYEIKARTMASPVSVSAWSGGEGEVYTNPDSDYVVNGHRVYDLKDGLGSKVLAVQLKEIIKE